MIAGVDSHAAAEAFSSIELRTAGRMTFRRGPVSPQARAVVQGLFDDVVVPAWPKGKQRRPSSLEATRRAVGALLADLLELEAEGLAGAHGASRRNFTGLDFGFDIFVRVKEALEAAGLLRVQLGFQHLSQFTNLVTGGAGPVISHGGEVSRYRLTPAGLDRVSSAGVELDAWTNHWGREPSAGRLKTLKVSTAPVVVLKARKPQGYGGKTFGIAMSIDEGSPKVAAIVQDLREHNAFVMDTGVGGIVFRGLRRVFNDGDQPGFDWQWGGRFFAIAGYEGAETPKTYERLEVITLGGERVGEVDLKAAHLCLLYALKGIPLEPGNEDPYALPGLDRELVKSWTVKALGAQAIDFSQWSRDAREYYTRVAPERQLSKDVPIASVRQAMVKRHPILGLLGGPGLRALDLQYHESEIVRMAMAALRADDIASLPVHDCLVVPITATDAAATAITRAFTRYIGNVTGNPCAIIPVVKIKRPEDLKVSLGRVIDTYSMKPAGP